MASNERHERFTSGNEELLSESVWDEYGPRTCVDCGGALVGSELRCRACGAMAPVCVGSCGACVSPVCVGRR